MLVFFFFKQKTAYDIDHTDRVIFKIRYDQLFPVSGHRQASRGRRKTSQPDPAGVAERDRAACKFDPCRRWVIEDMDIVVGSTGNVKFRSARVPSETVECVGHLQDLFLHRGAAGAVVDENVLVGLSGTWVPRRVILTVVAAGQVQKGLAFGAGIGACALPG